MSEHPRYLAIHAKRVEIIPIAFRKYSSDKFNLKEIEQKREDGYIDWPYFEVYDTKNKLVAVFYSDGKSECYAKSFREIHEKMVKEIEKAAFETKIEVEKQERREYAEIHGFDPTFYEKEREYLESQKKE
jgi:hypothetical protein